MSPDKPESAKVEREASVVDLRKLNALVAEKVMGWTLYREDHIFGVWHDEDGTYRGMENDPAFCSEIADAFRVVEKMTRLGWNFRVSQCGEGPGNHVARFWGVCGITAMAEGNTSPEAICRAALKALAPQPQSAPRAIRGELRQEGE